MLRLAVRVFAIAATLPLVSPASAVTPPAPSGKTLRFEVDKLRVDGRLLYWDDASSLILGRDGRMISFPGSKVKNWREVSAGFTSLSQSEMVAQLSREFGPAFEVRGTGHYLVVFPRGQREQWADRFEQLYRDLRHYFSVRGFQIREPQFPLVAVVARDRAEFQKLSSRESYDVPSTVAGFYLGNSNRVYLYDQTRDNPNVPWQENAATIIHEATHQTAYNVGIHNRFAGQPRWVVEGLGTLFESRGVYDSLNFRDQKERINRGQLQAFQRYLAKRPKDALSLFLGSDRPFSVSTQNAYAEAWALTFYLTETQPQRYSALLKRIAARPDFSGYSGDERLKDWVAVFGPDLKLFDAKYVAYMKGIK